jgi:hypothetical protein
VLSRTSVIGLAARRSREYSSEMGCRRFLAYVHLRATSCQCHRRIVSGVTTVASWRKTRRLSRWPRTASRRRSSSVNWSRCPPSGVEGSDSLQPDTPRSVAPGDPTNQSGPRAPSGEPTRRSRRGSISRCENGAALTSSAEPWDITGLARVATFAYKISLAMKTLRQLTDKRHLVDASIRVFFAANEKPA